MGTDFELFYEKPYIPMIINEEALSKGYSK
jgi:hypothetical protein